MQIRFFKRSLCAAGLCAAVLLSGCTAVGAASGSAFSAASSMPGAASSGSAASSNASCALAASSAASSPAQVAGLSDALNSCLGWGGDAGSSLKSMIAACALLDWGEDNAAAQLDAAALSAEAAQWVAGLDADQRATLAENWPGVSANADTLVSDPASVAALLDDAGKPNLHTAYTAANWEAVKAAVDAALAG